MDQEENITGGLNTPLSLDEMVEARLRNKQKGKTFQDTEGRIGGSAKQNRAYKMVSLENLSEIEGDEATAIELVKKDKVYHKIDLALERENGVSAGAAFLKQKMREAFGSQPPNKALDRKIYVGYAVYLYEKFKDVTSVEEFEKIAKNLVERGVPELVEIVSPDLLDRILVEKEYNDSHFAKIREEIFAIERSVADEKERLKGLYPESVDSGGYFSIHKIPVDVLSNWHAMSDRSRELWNERSNYEGLTPTEKSFLESIGCTNTRSGIYYIMRPVFERVFGIRFVNFTKQSSDPVIKNYALAKEYEAVSVTESLMLIDKFANEYKDRIVRIQAHIAAVGACYSKDQYDDFFLANHSREGGTGFSGGDFASWNKKGDRYWRYSDCKTPQQIEAYGNRYVTSKMAELESNRNRIKDIEKKYRARENDWSWAFDKKDATAAGAGKAKTELKVNSYPPLLFIKRVGGLKIDEKDFTPVIVKTDGKEFATFPIIQSKFGFNQIEFGQSLKDREANEHVRHFLGAISDMAEVLNMDIVKLNQLGGLSMAFASRGHGKASATYNGLRKIINITKVRGGGAVSHEYLHYLDNIIPKINRAEYSYEEFASVIKETYYGRIEGCIANEVVLRAMGDIFTYIYKRQLPRNGEQLNQSEPSIVIVKKKIQASTTAWVIPKTFYDYQKGTVTPADIEEYIEFFKVRYSQYRNIETLKKKDLDILGAIVHKFGFKEYEFSFRSNQSQYFACSKAMGSDYWTRPWELLARAFETYIYDKLEKAGRFNNYLVSGAYFGHTSGVYPEGAEREDLFKLYEVLMAAIKTEYAIGDFIPWTTERVDEYIDLPAEADKGPEAVEDDADKSDIESDTVDPTPEDSVLKTLESKKKLKELLLLLKK